MLTKSKEVLGIGWIILIFKKSGKMPEESNKLKRYKKGGERIKFTILKNNTYWY